MGVGDVVEEHDRTSRAKHTAGRGAEEQHVGCDVDRYREFEPVARDKLCGVGVWLGMVAVTVLMR